jgi:hypothetical protein
MPIRQRRKWTILACAAVLAFTAVAFATVGSSTFRSKTPQIQVVNNTEALAVVAQEVIDGRMRLHFKNISAKALNGVGFAETAANRTRNLVGKNL